MYCEYSVARCLRASGAAARTPTAHRPPPRSSRARARANSAGGAGSCRASRPHLQRASRFSRGHPGAFGLCGGWRRTFASPLNAPGHPFARAPSRAPPLDCFCLPPRARARVPIGGGGGAPPSPRWIAARCGHCRDVIGRGCAHPQDPINWSNRKRSEKDVQTDWRDFALRNSMAATAQGAQDSCVNASRDVGSGRPKIAFLMRYSFHWYRRTACERSRRVAAPALRPPAPQPRRLWAAARSMSRGAGEAGASVGGEEGVARGSCCLLVVEYIRSDAERQVERKQDHEHAHVPHQRAVRLRDAR